MKNVLPNLINEDYLNKDTIKRARASFLSNNLLPNIQLQSFLKENVFKALEKEMKLLSYSHNYKPDQHSYFTADAPESFISLVESQEFKEFISEVTGIQIKDVFCEASYFTHKNYTLLSDKQIIKEGIAFYFDFNNWNTEFGGYNWLLNNKEENIIYSPKVNSLLLVKQSNKLRSTIKYINHLAKANKRFIIKGFFTQKAY